MLTESIIIAILGFLGTGVGSFFAYNKGMALMEYRLKQLEDKVSAHNNLIDRVYQVEKDVAIVKEEIEEKLNY